MTTTLVVGDPVGGLLGAGMSDAVVDGVVVGRGVVVVGLGMVVVGWGVVVVGSGGAVVVVVVGGMLAPAASADGPVEVSRAAVPVMSAPAAMPARVRRADFVVDTVSLCR
ncbi:hypothetical protein ACFFSW_17165 [Saccharothrix longispora]|uniref:S-adenosylhomocysteine hydrolase n=1 Tax=Saccharothrix longispora TaxID=33920 RepID=A0ABU1PSJ8_9PSEU|nr:hypothetical protein [Saccharothrix longispora]MDR6593625.1 S-adenosylhomocysteine hydrolase [Saccharothrix longispora]